jgi:hypothetical protein
MKRRAAATAIVAALGIGASTASAGAVSMDRGPAGPICTAAGGVFLPPDESLSYYACSADYDTLGAGGIKTARNVCEHVYGAFFYNHRSLYWCQRDPI